MEGQPGRAFGVHSAEGSDDRDAHEVRISIVGRLLDAAIGDSPLTTTASRELLATVLGVPASALRSLAPHEVQRALSRLQALVERLSQAAAVDELTGATRRGVGLASVEREIERIRRLGGRMVVALVDVDGLKAVNDRHGHQAGDDLLRAVVMALRSHFRPYDLVIRYGGDEFVCAMPDADLPSTHDRFQAVTETLTALTDGTGSISVGITELRDGDTLSGLITRADADMYVGRKRRSKRREHA